MIAAGFIDHVAIRADLAPIPPSTLRKNPRSATDVPYLPLFPVSSTSTSHSLSFQQEGSTRKDQQGVVYIHPSSILSQLSPSSMPSYIIYSHISLSSPSTSTFTSTSTSTSNVTATPTTASTSTPILRQNTPRTRLHPLTPISGAQLAALAHGTPLLEYGKPVTGKGMVMPKPLPPLNEGGAQGSRKSQERRECWVVPYLRADVSAAGGGAGMQGWPLPAKKVVQRRVKGRGWVVE
jgi:ATP-dependent RNA helicase DHX37/DHR1